MKLSEHFDTDIDTRFTCRCCGLFLHNQRLIDALEHIRWVFGQPVHIVSGTRCPSHNAKVGGAQYSKHLTGEAADFYIEGVSPHDVYRECCKQWPDSHGIGHYHTFTHLDVRQEKARWSA